MHKILKILLISLSASFVFSAFVRPFNTSDLLTQSPWTSFELWKDTTGTGVFVFDTYECQQDNHWNFMSPNQFQITEDAIQCEPEMPFLDTLQGNWQLLNNDRILKFEFFEDDPINFEIYEIGEYQVTLDIRDVTGSVRERIILRR